MIRAASSDSGRWTESDLALLARCADNDLAVADGSDLLGVGMAAYRAMSCRLGLVGGRWASRVRCLMCRGTFRSPDRRRIRVCDPCKQTDRWRFARWPR